MRVPILAKCSDRNAMPKKNQITGMPDEWFRNDILHLFGYTGFTFDFFVDWRATPHQITPYAWVKRILPNAPATYSDAEIVTQLAHFEGMNHLKKFARYCAKEGLTLQYLLFRDIDWLNAAEQIIMIDVFMRDNELAYKVSRINLAELQNRIKNYSGGAVKIGYKGLIYGTSTLECYLSKTDSLYPGDVDLVIINDQLDTVALVEFKKHNLNTPITEQTLSKYYPRPDARKYDRLAILATYLKGRKKLITLFYPTRTSKFAKVERIRGQIGNLVATTSQLISLPRKNNKKSYENFVKAFLAFTSD